MNRAPGKHHVIARSACAMLRLSFLLLSSQALSQPAAPPAQYYYPGMPGPWNPQPPVQSQPVQPQLQPTMPPAVQPQVPPAPAWINPWQQPATQPATQYYTAPYSWGWPTAPAAPSYQQAQPAQPQVSAPYLETRIEGTSAYVHQNLVLTVNVVSTVNLKTANAEMQDSDDIILRQLGDITVDNRTREGKSEIVNTIYYLLTPMRSGDIELKPLHITGTMDSGMAYDAVDSQPIRLSVSAPDPGVQPWLPLHELELSATLSNDERVGEGEPLTLTVMQRAVGMSGTQLPSLETQLQSPGHRLYREKTEYNGVITREGKLVGTRLDRFTLVPQKGNVVKIPALRLDWWNVDRQRKETAVIPGRLLNETGRHLDEEATADGWQTGKSTGSLLMWLTLLAIAFMLGRYWKRLDPGLRRAGRQLWQQLEIVSKPARQRLAALLVRLSPQRNMHLMRRWVADHLPRSARVWFCVRSADNEQDPDDWSQVLRFLISRRLHLSANMPMSKLAEHIIEIHPGADADKIRSLLGELDAALFAGRTMRDFDSWKKEFKHQIRPRLLAHLRPGLRTSQRTFHTSSLPNLNPGVS